MNVLVLTTQFRQLGGAERLSVELASELKNNHELSVELASIYSQNVSGNDATETLIRDHGVSPSHYLGLKVNPKPWSMLSAILRLRKILKNCEFDVVETSLLTPAIIASFATIGLRTQHVSGIHDVYNNTSHRGLRFSLRKLAIRLSRRPKFYAISNYVRDRWIEYSKTEPSLTRVVYNGIPDSSFEARPRTGVIKRELGIDPDKRIILAVGRLTRAKGFDTLIEAVGPVLDSHELHVLHVGSVEESAATLAVNDGSLTASVNRLIKTKGWSDSISFLGWRSDVADLLASCDVFAHPARHEAFGLVLVEALASGAPVIASNVHGIPEVLNDTDSIMIDSDDPETLGAAILSTLDRSDEVAEAARSKGISQAEKFRQKDRASNMALLFKDIVDGRF